MPELPEVETTCRGIEPHILQHPIAALEVRHWRLRWPIDPELPQRLEGAVIQQVKRRGKYILLSVEQGDLLIHLGMSGSLRVLNSAQAVAKHDHFDLVFSSGLRLRYTDPRRFGALLWQPRGEVHPLLAKLGPEPLSAEFTPEHLIQVCKQRQAAIKAVIMDSHHVVGVGNIYASEALFAAGIDPRRAAGRISAERLHRLHAEIQRILAYAIHRGGTTLRDFVGGDGKPGYFQQELYVYGREGEACKQCQTLLKSVRIGQRSSVFCPQCQR